MYTPKSPLIEELRPKRSWALYRLQGIPPSKLAVIINRILRGDDILINALERSVD